MGPVSLQSSCLNINYYHSTLKYLSFKVLHDNTNQNHDFTHFRGTPILGGSKKGVRGVKKIGPQHFRVLYTLRVLQTKNQKMNTKIERKYISTCTTEELAATAGRGAPSPEKLGWTRYPVTEMWISYRRISIFALRFEIYRKSKHNVFHDPLPRL